jgi:acetoacetyl-CoA reductase/3-oxoacyl-[acyl-carrier protein] reductase
MAEKLEANVVLITGALSDIGQATAKAFAELGWSVVVNYRRNPGRAEAFAATLIQEWNAPRAVAVQGDVRSRRDVEACIGKAYEVFGRLDVLVNNAGLNRDKPFVEMSDDEWDTVLSTILTGTFLCSQVFARRYVGTDGNIVNIGATTGVKGRKNGANYCSARAGVLALTKCLALELAPTIRVNTVTPGCIDTHELRTRYHLDEESHLTRMKQRIPLGALGTPQDIAGMIVYLVTAGLYITGQNFFVDGGLLMR